MYVIPAPYPSTMSMTAVANNIIVPTRNINALIESAISLRLKKITMKDMIIITTDKGFAIAVFIPAYHPLLQSTGMICAV